MQDGHFFSVQNDETGSMDIFSPRKTSIPAVWTFFHGTKPRNLQYGHFFTTQNLHTAGMDILLLRKIPIPVV
jgi:ribosomal protein L13E